MPARRPAQSLTPADFYRAAQPALDWARAAVQQPRVGGQAWQVSDIIDHRGYQYVDLVMEGGGVLGIALVGYVYVLEQLNVRFLQLGGTSAGSINAMLMAAAGPVWDAKTEWLLTQLAAQDLYAFVDGDDDARDFAEVVLENGRLLKYFWKGAQVVDNFTEDLGLNPGHVFHAWVRGLLDERGIRRVADLNRLRTLAPVDGLRLRNGTPYAPGQPVRVAVVAADVTTESKAVFPEMAHLYYAQPEQVHPADFVRASMSIPFFFWPHTVGPLPGAGQPGGALWQDATGYCGLVPETVHFLDGGIMSNFPIDLFHQHYRVPNCPTLGIKLGLNRSRPNQLTKFTKLIGAMFDAARHVHDYDFIKRNPDFRLLVSYAETDQFNWLDFGLSDATKLELFAKGAAAAAKFVADFDWPGYRTLRQEMIKAYQMTDAMRPATGLT
ncbi:patatin-like phospholipase family protein [Hymenobacter saemangeumensis]|uniref:Patatin-like phospholipase family protein n=1 Tax=Hymenobacter saemangeumensis TaxID=1084522 RepID=A0ABP8IQ09_9BACT